MLLCPCSLTILAAAASVWPSPICASLITIGRFTPVTTSTLSWSRNVGRRSAEHVRQDQSAIGALYAFKRLLDHAGRHVDVVMPSQRDRRYVMDLTDDHLSGIQKLDGHPPMGD